MITKFKSIKNLAVFKEFDWDSSVRAKKGNNTIEFKKLNILYGRNYSGKTTLSRIVRALETGQISDKYENPECCICITDNADVSQLNFRTHNKTIRVFNEDFIKENLKFIVNPKENVVPFAILGEGNNEIEAEINSLKERLGSNESDKETGLHKDLKSLNALYQAAKKSHSDAQTKLNNLFANKATGRPSGIKYETKYGEVNYNINRLKADIESVKKNTYKPLLDEEKLQADSVLKEQTKNEIPALASLNLKLPECKIKASEAVSREIGRSNKIQELVKDAVLNRWVKEGRKLHQDKLDVCSFCNSPINESRWNELDKHFDEESEKLERDINNLLSEITNEKNLLLNFKIFNIEQVYSKYHTNYALAKQTFKSAVQNYKNSLELIESQLEERKKNILNQQVFKEVIDFSSEVENAKKELADLREKSNDYSNKLNADQNKAKENLRLNEIFDFINDINYFDLIASLDVLKKKEESEKDKTDSKQIEINDILEEISAKQKELEDEIKGADKVNEYLNDHFGHDFLSLKAVEFEDEDTCNKIYRFETHREGKKAYHLSEGEKSLIAFCYFVAKLEDVATKDKNPIVWIDDPISSFWTGTIFFSSTHC